MIFVDGVPFPSPSSNQGSDTDTLAALMEHPTLLSASNSFKATPERKFSVPEESVTERSAQSKWVYLFQREFATVDPALVDFVGTDEATTCIGLAIRNRKNGMISVAHVDSPEIVDMGLSQMLSGVVDFNLDADLDVHLLGSFEDFPPRHSDYSTNSESHENMDGCSLPLCTKIVETLRSRREKFHIQTLCILGHNTRRDSNNVAYPIFNGLVVETSSGSVLPASFDRTSRCPDEVVRRIRVTAAYEDSTWNGKLLETYDTQTDRFIIAPCCWTRRQVQIANSLKYLSDTEILHVCSTSPSAEGPDFVENERRIWDYLIKQPDWRKTFPGKRPRIFERTDTGGWKRC
ncbi:hypothetical protein FEM48_Zijuj01G0026100 [Ziziphus jujuba var. spinosa]|uniref:Protein N-terminal asparagine amidohydrolase n=1 Tax=Ziziphus jujuba var. spinosa TaxID=714518 RepID=A0A978VYM9_ZIZJJ|nr:hypothetical protein FEM48_Zijuj01G0026100 [Ziziphus jujuba var. spinosa]